MPSLAHVLQMFGQAPLRPLQAHMEKAYACVELMLPFFQATLVDDWQQAQVLQQQIAHLENEADELKKSLRLHLPKRLFLPISRSDLLEILTIQDELPNKAKDIAGLVIGRQLKIPQPIAELFLAFLKKCIEAAKQGGQTIKELDELLESDFRGNEVKTVENMIIELDRIEHTTDEMQVEIRSILFKLEATMSPVDVIFLYKIIEWTGDLADHAHSLGGQLYLILAR